MQLLRQTGCRSCVSSPGICRRSTQPARCHPSACCRTGADGRSPYLYTPEEIEALMLAARRCSAASLHRGDDADADRADGGHRDADRGGDRPRSRRRRPPPQAPTCDRQQVRQEPGTGAARDARWPRWTTTPGCATGCARRPSCAAFFISRNGTRLLSQCVHFVFARLVKTVGLEPRPGCAGGHARTTSATASLSPRSSTGTQRHHERAGPAAVAVDLHGARGAGEHLLLPDRHAAAA